MVREATRALNLPSIEMEGYEADDLIELAAARRPEEAVTAKQAQRDQLVNESLNVIGPRMERNLTAIMESAFEDGAADQVALRIRARDGLGVAWLPRSLVEPDIDGDLAGRGAQIATVGALAERQGQHQGLVGGQAILLRY